MIPKRTIILLSGIPAIGKTTFANRLAHKHGFAHYDMECYPQGWPRPELKQTWDRDRAAFVALVPQHHDRIVLDWGFPVSAFAWIQELINQGVRLIWFTGDVDRAREVFLRRGKGEVRAFDEQVAAIQNAAYPVGLDCVIVPVLSASGTWLGSDEIRERAFRNETYARRDRPK